MSSTIVINYPALVLGLVGSLHGVVMCLLMAVLHRASEGSWPNASEFRAALWLSVVLGALAVVLMVQVAWVIQKVL